MRHERLSRGSPLPSGGYREPANPAPASGPGRLSRRTDGGPAQSMRQLGNAGYGEQTAFEEQQAGAPMAMDDMAAGGPGAAPGSPVEVTPFGAPSGRPGEPITAGAPIGAGMGPEGLGLTTIDELLRQDRQTLSTYLPVLEFLSNQPNAMPSLRSIVRQIRAAVNA